MPGSRWRCLLVGALTSAALLGISASAQASRLQPLRPPAGGVVHATVALAPRDPAALAAYASAVTTPGSPFYHRYLTVAQFVRRFGPGAGKIAKVRIALAAQGLTPGRVSANGLTLPVTSTALAFDAFSRSYRPRGASGDRPAQAGAPALAGAIAGLVQGLIGPDSAAPSASAIVSRARDSDHMGAVGRRTALTAVDTGAGAAGPQPCAAAQSAGAGGAGYTANQISTAYGLSTYYAAGDAGRGITIALYELEPFSASDVAAYQACYGTSATVATIPIDGGAGSGAGSGEAAMDLEDLIGLAPRSSVRVYEGPATGVGAYDTYSRIVSDNTAQVISTSWGLCEALGGAVPAAAESTLFQEAAIQGQSVLASAGDQGSDACGDHRQGVVDPSSQPWVTGVGATSLGASGDVVWNDSQGATGGGSSQLWGRPAYQQGVALPQSGVRCGLSSNTCREVPDVAVDGDPNTGYVAYYLGAWRTVGGSSMSAPTFAALTALADASAACAGRRIGFLNPALYRAAAKGYAANFHDVASGANGYDGVPGFAAGPGYDMASGLGAPAASLGLTLCRGSITLKAPRAQSAVAGHAVHLQLAASASPGNAIRYSGARLPTGLTLHRASGKISGKPNAAGTWRVTVTASTAGGTATASFIWTVREARHGRSGAGRKPRGRRRR
jgi:subtilase family serine protease